MSTGDKQHATLADVAEAIEQYLADERARGDRLLTIIEELVHRVAALEELVRGRDER